MPVLRRSSRRRFEDYRQVVRERNRLRNATTDEKPDDLALAETRSTQRGRPFPVLFRSFLTLIRPHWGVIALCLATVTVSTLLALVPITGTKIVFDCVLSDGPLPGFIPSALSLPKNPKALLFVVAAAMMGFAAASLAVGMIGRWHMTRTTKHVQAEVRRVVFDHAVRLPLHRGDQLRSGGVANILREDAGGVGELLFAMLYNPWRAVVQLIGSLVILTWTDWRLLIGSLALLPIVWFTHKTWIGRIRPMYRDIRASRQHISAHTTEVFAGMRVVRGFNRQRTEAARFTGNNHFMSRQELLAWWWARGVDIAWSILIPVATAAVLAYGSIRVIDDAQAVRIGTLARDAAFTPGDLVMFLTFLGWLLEPIATLAASATQFQSSLAGLDRVLDLLAEPLEFPANPNARPITTEQARGQVNLRGVRFTYPGRNEPVIRGIDLDVPPGQTIALVGPSGSGKTTLCNLIARFFDPTDGHIELDGTDLRELQISGYRSLLGIVEQDVFLFDGTIAANIGYAKRGADRDQIIRAAELANAHSFIARLDRGYDTLVGERGVKLSGGERQRLAIARAILADPKLLILDEATSNLDTESERLIQSSLAAFMDGRTCFVIAHRLSTIQHADMIVVLVNGQIIERGKHSELMQRSGRYRRMVDLQTQPME